MPIIAKKNDQLSIKRGASWGVMKSKLLASHERAYQIRLWIYWNCRLQVHTLSAIPSPQSRHDFESAKTRQRVRRKNNFIYRASQCWMHGAFILSALDAKRQGIVCLKIHSKSKTNNPQSKCVLCTHHSGKFKLFFTILLVHKLCALGGWGKHSRKMWLARGWCSG